MCRQAGYLQQGLGLARQFHEHEWYLRIQLEDSLDYEDALRYIEGLSFSEIESNLIIYGKKLVAELPHETTILVKKICTGLATDDAPQKVRKSDPEKFLHIFINCPNLFLEFLEEIVEVWVLDKFICERRIEFVYFLNSQIVVCTLCLLPPYTKYILNSIHIHSGSTLVRC